LFQALDFSKVQTLLQTTEPHFIEYQKQVLSNAKAMADTLVQRGYTLISGLFLFLLCCRRSCLERTCWL